MRRRGASLPSNPTRPYHRLFTSVHQGFVRKEANEDKYFGGREGGLGGSDTAPPLLGGGSNKERV